MVESPEIDIRSEPYTARDVQELLKEIEESPFIGHISLEEIMAFVRANTIRLYYQDGTLMGFGAWTTLTDGWIELGPIYVSRAGRGQGLGRIVFEHVVNARAAEGNKLWAVTKNPIIMHLFGETGFREVNTWRLPREIKRHLIRRITWQRIISLVTKFHPGETVRHYIQD